MTSKPASRSARATILAPRSWPSRPGWATTTRILRSVMMGSPSLQELAQPLPGLHDLIAVAGDELPVEALAVAVPARDEVQVEVRDGHEGGGAVGLEQVEPVGAEGMLDGRRYLLGRDHDRLEVFHVGLVNGGRVCLCRHQAVSGVYRGYVHERERALVLVDLERGDLPVPDLAEDTVHRASRLDLDGPAVRVGRLAVLDAHDGV